MKINPFAFLLFSFIPVITTALEVDREVMPRINVAGEIIATHDNTHFQSTGNSKATVNVDDSALMLTLDKKLFDDGVGGARIGFKEANPDVKYHLLHTFYWNQSVELLLGRSTINNTLLEFPLMRDEDLLSFTHIGNAQSNEEFDQQFAATLFGAWYFDKKNQSIEAWASDLRNETSITRPKGFNYHGLGYHYKPNDDIRYTQWIREAGVQVSNQRILANGDTKHLTAWLAGLDVNFHLNPQFNWSGFIQGIYNHGLKNITSAQLSDLDNHISNQARAKSTSFVAGLRYTHRPMLLTRWQAGLTVGYKKYSNVKKASVWSIVPNVAYQLGMGFSVNAQYKHIKHRTNLFNGATDKVIQLGLVYDLDMEFNHTFTERNSIIRLKNRNLS